MQRILEVDPFTAQFLNTAGMKVPFDPLCIHIKRLKNYQPDISLEQILVFEALLLKSRGCSNRPFYYQLTHIAKDTRLKRAKVDNALKALISAGYVKKTGKTQKGKHLYKIDFEVIKNNIEKIYVLQGDTEEEKRATKQVYVEYFERFAGSRNKAAIHKKVMECNKQHSNSIVPFKTI